MIYYIECGNKFTLEYGDIDEVFYDTLIEMYEKAIDCVCKMPRRKQAPFRKRLEKIMKSSAGIGWGYMAFAECSYTKSLNIKTIYTLLG
jgi:hypothetical protein